MTINFACGNVGHASKVLKVVYKQKVINKQNKNKMV
jgi:hypothetical protein